MMRRLKDLVIPHHGNDYVPLLFRERVVGVLAVVSVLLFAGYVAVSSESVRRNLIATIYPSVLVDVTNQHREQYDVSPLATSTRLIQAARMKARHMAEHSYFAHFGPEGRAPWDWIAETGYPFTYAGENLAANFEETTDVADAWMDSPSHRRNVLSENFTEIGIATATGMFRGHEVTYVVQMFGHPYGAADEGGGVGTARVDAVAVDAGSAQPPVAGVQSGGKQSSDSSEQSVEVISRTKEFIAARNTNARSAGTTPQSPGARLIEHVLREPGSTVMVIVQTLMLIVAAGLLILVGVNIRVQRPRNIIYGVLLVVIMGTFYYLTALLSTGPVLSFMNYVI